MHLNNEQSIISNDLEPLMVLATKVILRMNPNSIFKPMKMPYTIPVFVGASCKAKSGSCAQDLDKAVMVLED